MSLNKENCASKEERQREGEGKGEGEGTKMTIVKQKSDIDLNELQLKLTNLQLSKMATEEETNSTKKEEEEENKESLKEKELTIEKKDTITTTTTDEDKKDLLPNTSFASSSASSSHSIPTKENTKGEPEEERPTTTSRMSSSTSGNNSVQEDDEFVSSTREEADNSSSLSNAVTASPLPVSEANSEEKIDVGMGSSIECSEESEEDDELKPLASDNHMLMSAPRTGGGTATAADPALMLSESNLEKFHHHLQQQNVSLDSKSSSIYLHPNFEYDNLQLNKDAETGDVIGKCSKEREEEVEVIVPSNSPVEESQMHVHRSFLTMKSKLNPDAESLELEKAQSVISQNSKGSVKSEELDEKLLDGNGESLVNEIDNLSPDLIPDEELTAQIVEAVEYYFSNECILKDAFLLKHVRRNKEGFVSLKLVSSFKRVRQLTKDWRVVGYAVRSKSEKIAVNDIGTKVRRLEVLPNFDETMPSRTVVATELPLEKMTIEKVSEIFAKCGDIALIRLLKPGMTIPVDVRQFMNKYPEMQQKECALIEYVDSASARSALQLEGTFKVYEMVPPKKKTGKKALNAGIPLASNSPLNSSVAGRLLLENPYHHHHHHQYQQVSGHVHDQQVPYERPRGGSFSGVSATLPATDLRFRLKRFNSDVYSRVYGLQKPSASSQYLDGLDPSVGGEVMDAVPLNYHHHHHHHQVPVNGGGGRPFRPRAGSLSFHELNSNYNGGRRFSNATQQHQQQQQHSFINEEELPSVMYQQQQQQQRRYSNLPQEIIASKNGGGGAGGQLEMTRRPSIGSGGHTNNFTESMLLMSRRDSNCSVDNSPPPPSRNRRLTPPEFVAANGEERERPFRKTSQTSSTGSVVERRYSNGSMHYDVGEQSFPSYQDRRRLSSDYSTLDRKSLEAHLLYENDATQTQLYHLPRRYSNNFYQLLGGGGGVGGGGNAAKLAMYERRISNDSGYDRRCSFGSEYENSPRSRTGSFLSNEPTTPRSRTGSFIGQFESPPRSRTGSFLEGGTPRSRSGSFAQRTAEVLVRTPLGPDGSKGFGSRLRKTMESVQPVN